MKKSRMEAAWQEQHTLLVEALEENARLRAIIQIFMDALSRVDEVIDDAAEALEELEG